MTDHGRPRLTFFFPAYNEEENLAETVRRALEEIGPLVDGSIEVLAVDDGSTDRTPELADALAAADPRVRVHHQQMDRVGTHVQHPETPRSGHQRPLRREGRRYAVQANGA